jgi:hypothetical protein
MRTASDAHNLACIIDISDGSWCSLLVATCPLCPQDVAIVSLDTHELSAMIYQQIASHHGLEDRVQIAHVTNISATLDGNLDTFKSGVSNVVLLTGEPFYHKMRGREDMQCINYWHIVSSLRKKFHHANPTLSVQVQSLPARAVVRGMAVRFKHFALAYGKNGMVEKPTVLSDEGIRNDKCGRAVVSGEGIRNSERGRGAYCGFDHSTFERHRSEAMETGGLLVYTWMYDYTPVSEPFDLFPVDFATDPSKQCNTKARVPCQDTYK